MNDTNATTAAAHAIHPFEKAGLGKAPFRLVGEVYQEISYGRRVIGSIGGATVTTTPGGTCEYCGQYIINMFRVESADGNRFVVGCDCVNKVSQVGGKVEGEGKIPELLKKMKKARDESRIEAAKKMLPDAHALKSSPHPNHYRASVGATLWDYANFLIHSAGMTGRLKAARMIEAACTPKIEE
jgi:hypothetical protein